jgi:hypothetical protein
MHSARENHWISDYGENMKILLCIALLCSIGTSAMAEDITILACSGTTPSNSYRLTLARHSCAGKNSDPIELTMTLDQLPLGELHNSLVTASSGYSVWADFQTVANPDAMLTGVKKFTKVTGSDDGLNLNNQSIELVQRVDYAQAGAPKSHFNFDGTLTIKGPVIKVFEKIADAISLECIYPANSCQ